MSFFLTVDPGLGGTGLAVFDTEQLAPINTAVLNFKTAKADWIDRATEIVEQLDAFLEKYNTKFHYLSAISTAYIELPAFFTSAKGASCATGKDGGDSDLVKLAVLIGRFYEVFAMRSIKIKFIRVNDWKGTLSKEAVIKRICSRLKCPIDAYPNHVADSVGIGLFVKNCFAANTGVKE